MPLALRPVEPARHAEARDVLFEAFRDDPTLRWCCLAREPGYAARLRGYLETGHAWHVGVGNPVTGAIDDAGRLLGVLYGMRPDVAPAPDAGQKLHAALRERCGEACGERFARYNAAVEAAWPDGRHHVLALVGVREAARRSGVGSALVAAWSAVADADPQRGTCILDTAKPANLPFYARLGYRTVATVRVDGLEEWVLQRPFRGEGRLAPAEAG